MTGIFTDNQPDFSWLMPDEQKSFTQYFLPYQELGVIKNASKDILLAADATLSKLHVKIYTTSVHQQITLNIFYYNDLIFEENISVSPENIFARELFVNEQLDDKQILITITAVSGIELLRYDPSKNMKNCLPETAKSALPANDITTNEELFLTGQHLEQYRHATYNPVDYYQEALRRDPADIRNNNALGKWYLRKGQFIKSEAYLKKAIETSTQRNPNPYDSEPYYNLGTCLLYGKNR